MARNLTSAQLRKRSQDRMGWTIIAVCGAALIAFGFGCYKMDQARGISIDQSLRSAGL